jgi:hypothetical protein
MASLLLRPAEAAKYTDIANKIKKGINTYLWQPVQKYYGQYLYGRKSQILSPKAEALGEALAIVFGIADSDKQKQIVAHTPVTDFGISCIYPQIPNIPPYHNNAVWPFVQTFWLWAGAKAANEKAVMESIAAIYRPAALFVTNKENFVADNGDFLGTQINSSNMLWSLSGNISIVHKVLFGIRFHENSLSFEPFVPSALKGTRSLKNFKYRDALLNIVMEGSGNRIKQFILDGKPLTKVAIPIDLNGEHNIKIVLANNLLSEGTINKVANYSSLSAPDAVYGDGKLKWSTVSGAKGFKILKNGKLLTTTKANEISIPQGGFAEYQVIAVDNKGVESFASEPIAILSKKYEQVYEAEDFVEKAEYPYQGYSGKGFIEISLNRNKAVTIPVTVPEDGLYAIDLRYANGNGPTNTENKCALRTLEVDGKRTGTSLFPQRGKGEWSNWGYSNSIKVHLSKGKHTVSLIYEGSNENMNEVVNQAMIDQIRLIQIGIL